MKNPSLAAKRVLVFMPMLPGYEGIRDAVASVVSDAQLELLWLKDLLEDWEWLDWLYTSVNQCDLVVADSSEHNAFVMYELGVARPQRHPTLLILDANDSQITGSLDGSPFLLYSREDLEPFSKRFRQELALLAAAKIDREKQFDPEYWYQPAKALKESFVQNTSQIVEEVNKEAFTYRLTHSWHLGTFVPELAQTPPGDASLLTALIKSSRFVPMMAAIQEWVNQKRIKA